MPLVVVDRHPDAAVLTQELAQQLQPRQHHAEPLAVLEVVALHEQVVPRCGGIADRGQRRRMRPQHARRNARGNAKSVFAVKPVERGHA
jgi:hypothetical protein